MAGRVLKKLEEDGLVISQGFGLTTVPLAAAVLAILALIATLLTFSNRNPELQAALD